MKDILELHEFFVEGKDRRASHVLLHITEPSTPEELEKGYFFAAAELLNGTPEQVEHIQQMIDDLESGYYETDDEEDKSAFEITLEYINRRGHHILQYQQSQLHAIVGVVRKGEISFAYHGSPIATVFFQTKQGHTQMSVVDPNDAPEGDQLFSSILEGTIKRDDFFFVATPHVGQYFSEDRLQKIITTRTTRESATHIQKVLQNLRSEESFGGILFRVVSKSQLPKTGKMPAHLKQGSADSLKKLVNSQQETSETLHPPLLSRASDFLGKYMNKDKKKAAPKPARPKRTTVKRTNEPQASSETNHRERVAKKPRHESVLNAMLVGLGKALVTIFQFILLVLQHIITFLRKGFVMLFVLITNKGGGREQVRLSLQKSIRRRKEAFQNLPMMSKILFIATIIFAVIFVGSIFFLRFKEARDAKQQAYVQTIQAITDKKDAAEASMIYGDDERAFTLLKEAQDLVAALPTKSNEEQTKATELHDLVEQGLQELRKLEVAEPAVLASLKEANVTDLALLGDQLMAFGPDDNTLYLVNKQTGSIEPREHTAIPNIRSASTPKEDDFAVFTAGADSIARLTKDGYNLSAKEISFPTGGTTLSDIFIYNRRAYTLDPTNKQIFKHGETGTGYGQGAEWITSATTDISNAVSLAIDGDVFVLTADGQIARFEGGQEVDFSLSGLDPVLQNPTQIWTYNDVDNIYVVEPTNKRLVILDKEGKLIKQITANTWQGPTGMVIDEPNGTAYVLDANTVYRVSL